MALVVDTDSYISQADATTYIDSYYPAADTGRVAWNLLSTGDKDAYLRNALLTLDNIPIVGLKAVSTQTLAFPRTIPTEDFRRDSTVSTNLNYGSGWETQTEVPSEVKYAQVEIALDAMSGVSDRAQLQREGVKSFKLGNLSESYGSGKDNKLPYTAEKLMKPYLLGGGRIG